MLQPRDKGHILGRRQNGTPRTNEGHEGLGRTNSTSFTSPRACETTRPHRPRTQAGARESWAGRRSTAHCKDAGACSYSPSLAKRPALVILKQQSQVKPSARFLHEERPQRVACFGQSAGAPFALCSNRRSPRCVTDTFPTPTGTGTKLLSTHRATDAADQADRVGSISPPPHP